MHVCSKFNFKNLCLFIYVQIMSFESIKYYLNNIVPYKLWYLYEIHFAILKFKISAWIMILLCIDSENNKISSLG